jgi:NADH-quinone oxidoreductase subunit K
MIIGLAHYITLAAILFTIGVAGIILNHKNIALFILTVAAAEAAIGLAILVAYYRNRGSIAVQDINALKG